MADPEVPESSLRRSIREALQSEPTPQQRASIERDLERKRQRLRKQPGSSRILFGPRSRPPEEPPAE